MKTTKETIVAGIRDLGLKSGDLVLLHSALSSLGDVDGGADTVIDAFIDTLGVNGTLVVPTFGKLGIITETLRKREKSVESVHPYASVAAIGKDAETICRDHWRAETAHGDNTPYSKIADLDGYVCLLGVDQDRNTTLHTVEALLKLPYLKRTNAQTFETSQGTIEKSWAYFPGPHRDFIGFDHVLKNSGKMKVGRISGSVARLIKSQDLIELGLEHGKRRPTVFLCDNPSCDDCVKQRSDLRKSIFKRESFTLVVSSKLAGRYVPEIIENMSKTGVEHLEIDCLQGRPLEIIDKGKLTESATTLRSAGLEIASGRLNSFPDSNEFEKILMKIEQAGIRKLVMPFCDDLSHYLNAADSRDIDLFFYNLGFTSSKLAEALQSTSAPINFVFNPANFAKCGEKPFLGAFVRNKLKKFLTSLDIVDATFAGDHTPLAKGNAEIKELVSILRCSSFSGVLTLTAANSHHASLLDTVCSLESLLDVIS